MSMSLHHQIVARARRLVTRSGGWVQGMLAAKADGECVCPTDATAVRFCAVGALVRAACDLTAVDKNGTVRLAMEVHGALLPFVHGCRSLEALNDSENGLAKVLTVFEWFLTGNQQRETPLSQRKVSRRTACRRAERAGGGKVGALRQAISRI